jgi:D-glycero-alpha-D-manno-heptose-7-phosphate kinase
MPNKKQLALESIHIEQNMIKETVGSQDQVSAAYGKMNRIDFHTNGSIEVKPITVLKSRLKELDENLMLFYTGIIRTASDVAKSYVEDIHAKESILKQMQQMVDEGISLLQRRHSIEKIGFLLHETWKAKRSMSGKVTNSSVNELYNHARKHGAIGGKITGAGGGGFLLLFVPTHYQTKVREALGHLIHVPFRFDIHGSQIIFMDPEQKDYRFVEKDNECRKISCFHELDTLYA